MLRPPGVTDAAPARRVRGRRSSLVLGVLVLTAVVSTRWVRPVSQSECARGVYGLVAVPVNGGPVGHSVVLPGAGHGVQPWHRLVDTVAQAGSWGCLGDVRLSPEQRSSASTTWIMVPCTWRAPMAEAFTPTRRGLPDGAHGDGYSWQASPPRVLTVGT